MIGFGMLGNVLADIRRPISRPLSRRAAGISPRWEPQGAEPQGPKADWKRAYSLARSVGKPKRAKDFYRIAREKANAKVLR